MATHSQILFSLIFFEIMLFPLLASAYSVPGDTSPLSALLPNNGGTTFGAGTGPGGLNGNSTNISPQTQQIQSCVVGGVAGGAIGATTGAIIGLAFFGVGAIPGSIIGGLIGGGALGCGISAAFFPQQGSNVFNQVANSVPILGDFLKALAVALSYVGPLISFVALSVKYEVDLFLIAPEIGAFLGPLQGITLVWFFWTVAQYFRGSTTMGA